MARYQADVAEKNADLDEFRAQQAATIGAVQEEQHRAKVRQLAGAQRADSAARGIDLRSAVVQDLVGETYTMGDAPALTICFNAMNDAWDYRTQSVHRHHNARLARLAGNTKSRTPALPQSTRPPRQPKAHP